MDEFKKRLRHAMLINKVSAYKNCFTDEVGNLSLDGKRVVKDLMKYCSIDKSTACFNNNNSIDPIRMAFEEGKRTVLLRILDFVDTSEAQLQKLVKDVDGDSDY
jgi:hypothetical protein